MNLRLLEELAHQHAAARQPHRDAGASRRYAPAPGPTSRAETVTSSLPRQSLRERTGWTLVGLGLRLASGARTGPLADRPS